MFNNYYIRIDLNKNSKFPYYVKHMIQFLTPPFITQKKLSHKLMRNSDEKLKKRVNYYHKVSEEFHLSKNALSIRTFKKEKKTTYFFDLYAYLRYFPSSLKIQYIFGDVIDVPDTPTFVKSRPINGDNKNAILMKLNKVRHFNFIKDKKPFSDKKNELVWRGKAHMPHRQKFVKSFYNHPSCDIGETKKHRDKSIPWQKGKLRIQEQLEYKFILAIEGNDVASNLKWVMSSNSLCFMTKPRYETWFMEGTLVENYHYVLLKDDYSDLDEKIAFFAAHEVEALQIISHAHEYVAQFDNEDEELLSLLVLQKYFKLSNQL